MKVKIYDMGPYLQQLKPYKFGYSIVEHIKRLGFNSCEFIDNYPIGASYWGMDEVEFTWFALKYSR